MSIRETPKWNYRLERIAETICSCDMTDGFCAPRHNPDCRCWRYAKLAVQGLRNTANPALAEAWPDASEDQRRVRLNRLLDAILNRSDERTAKMAALAPERAGGAG